jgi:AcrR family transcriptional regulator
MKTEKKSDRTKRRILDAAAAVFAEKGFDGARVDDIAKRSKVNIALVYRYFKSKEKLLEALLNRFISDVTPIRETLTEKPLPSNREEFQQLIHWAVSFLHDRRDLLKIVLMEALKGSKRSEHLFRLFDVSLMNKLKDSSLDVITSSFFFGLSPLLMFFVFAEQFAGRYQLDPDAIQREFTKAFDEVYVTYILRNIESGT